MSLAPKPIHAQRPSSWRSTRRQMRKQIQEASLDMLQRTLEASDLATEMTSTKGGATAFAPAQRKLRRSLSSPVAGRKSSRMLRLETSRQTDVYETVKKVATARQIVTSTIDEIDSNDKDPAATRKSRRRKQSAMTRRVSSRPKKATSTPTPRRTMSEVSHISSTSTSSGSSPSAASTRGRRNSKGRSMSSLMSQDRCETPDETPLANIHRRQRRRSSADGKTRRRSGSRSKLNNLAKKRVDSAPSIPRKAPESLSSSSSSSLDKSTRLEPSFDEPNPSRNGLRPSRYPSRSQSLIDTKKEAQEGHPMSYLQQTSRILSSIAAPHERPTNTYPREIDKEKKDETINQEDQKMLFPPGGPKKKGTAKSINNNREKTSVPSLGDVLRKGGSSSRSITERTGSTLSTDQSSPSLENQAVLMSPLVTRLSPAQDSLSSLFHDLKSCNVQLPILDSDRVLEKRKKNTKISLCIEEKDEGESDIDSIQEEDVPVCYDDIGDASISSESPMMPNMGQAVSFSTVSIREYARTVGDNPSVSSGTPIGLDWTYYCTNQVHVDYYERKVRKRGPRTRRDFYLSAQSRFHLLLDEWDFSVQDISHATERASEIRHLRQVSIFGEGSPMAAQPAADRWDAIPSMHGSMSL